MPTDEQRARTLERFEQHRRAWRENAALRALYTDWYGRVAAELPDRARGPWIELGSGPGLARELIPGLELTDIVRAPWHDREMSAESLALPDRSVGALVLFDVIHHLGSPAAMLAEAERVLCPGGRLVACEPYLSPLSYPIYKLLHEEPVHVRGVDPLAGVATDKDPFDSNQAIPTLLFCRRAGREALWRRFPRLALRKLERLAGPSYAASGGFSGRPLLPLPLWRLLHRLEGALPPAAFWGVGFRVLAVLEKAEP